MPTPSPSLVATYAEVWTADTIDSVLMNAEFALSCADSSK